MCWSAPDFDGVDGPRYHRRMTGVSWSPPTTLSAGATTWNQLLSAWTSRSRSSKFTGLIEMGKRYSASGCGAVNSCRSSLAYRRVDRCGSLFNSTLLGSRARDAGSRSSPDAAGIREALRQTPEERCRRCGGNLRSGDPSDHAVCGGEVDGTAGCVGRGKGHSVSGLALRVRRFDKGPFPRTSSRPTTKGRKAGDMTAPD